MSRFIVCLTSVMLIAGSTATANAEDAHMKWWKYLKGEWTYKISPADETGTATWRIAAKGNALIGRFKVDGGDIGIELAGWDSDTKTEIVNGYGSRGNYWKMALRNHTDKTVGGDNSGKTPDGTLFKGKILCRKINDDTYSWEFKGEKANGEPMTMSATFKRKKE